MQNKYSDGHVANSQSRHNESNVIPNVTHVFRLPVKWLYIYATVEVVLDKWQ